METVNIQQRGVERQKAPTLAEDGGSIECINLRPTANGLELAHDKKHRFSASYSADSNADNVTAVYRHRALPEGWFVVVLNKRKLVVFKDEGGELSPMVDAQKNIVYVAQYDEDILNIGELNNVLVVRISNRQDYYLWHEDRYRLMPAIKMPQSMSLTQDFTSDKPNNVFTRPFFQAVTSFEIPFMDKKWDKGGDKLYNQFVTDYNANRDSVLQFIQGLRAEEEANQRKIGKFVGHVLVRCSFKTAQGNYIAYGSVLHAEIGSWASACRTSRFPLSTGEEDDLPYYQRLFRNIIRAYAPLLKDNKGFDDKTSNSLGFNGEDNGGKTATAIIPVASFRACVNGSGYSTGFRNGGWGVGQGKVPVKAFSKDKNYDFEYSHEDLISGAGLSQLPVWIGAVPYPVWKKRNLRGVTNNDDNKRKRYAGIKEATFQNFTRTDNTSAGGSNYEWMVDGRSSIGVYAPSIHYSYPILRLEVDEDFIEALKFYKETNIVTSLCIAMTAPVKHGNGTTLQKVYTVTKDNLAQNYDNYLSEKVDPDENTNPDDIEPDDREEEDNDTFIPDDTPHEDYVSGDPGNEDYMYVYGYPRNPDTDPEKMMNRNFYIVKDIEIGDLLDMVKENRIEIPLRLKDIGAVEKIGENGQIDVEISQEAANNSLKEQIDPNYVSLNTIESAKPLPTDSFTGHTVIGDSYMEYNRRLHLFGVSVLMSDGYIPTSAFSFDQKGFGENHIVKRGDTGFKDNLYMEYELQLEKIKTIRRTPIDSYLVDKNGKMIMNDILTYPDYRCTKMRLVEKKSDGLYYLIGEEMECKSSVLNNLAYVANTFVKREDLPKITFTAPQGLVIHDYYKWCKSTASTTLYQDPINTRNLANTGENYTREVQNEMCAYKKGDILFYAPRVVDLSNVSNTPLDHSGIDDSGRYEDSNRVQVSETDDVFSYPALNSYRAGSIENKIIAANSVYGQVTEQKFGMFPIYLFTKEGIFLMEQGTGNILYSNVSKVNDDVLSNMRSICNAGDMVAYCTLDGLRLIQGRESTQVSDKANGTPFIDLAGENSPFRPTVSEIPLDAESAKSFADYLSRVRLADEIQGCEMLWDSYNKEVVLLCHGQGDRAVTWAYNVVSGQMYKRKDILNDRSGFGVVLNGKNLVWCGKILFNARATFPTFKFPKNFDIFDFNTSDQETDTDGNPDKQQFLYISNPIKAGSVGYKHIEHSVLRMFGQELDMAVEYFGSLDGKKWFKMGGGRIADKEEFSDMLMRRMPCSTRYIVVVIKGNAAKLQIRRLEAEVQPRYATRLR